MKNIIKKRSKYGVNQTKEGKQDRTYKGITYDSKTEMQFMKEFIEPKIESGEILKFERQVTYVLQDGFKKNDGQKILPIKYKSDFDIWFSDGTFRIFDVKGQPDNLCLLKRKMFWNRYPDKELIFICRNLKYGGWVPFDDLKIMKAEYKKNKHNKKAEDKNI